MGENEGGGGGRKRKMDEQSVAVFQVRGFPAR